MYRYWIYLTKIFHSIMSSQETSLILKTLHVNVKEGYTNMLCNRLHGFALFLDKRVHLQCLVCHYLKGQCSPWNSTIMCIWTGCHDMFHMKNMTNYIWPPCKGHPPRLSTNWAICPLLVPYMNNNLSHFIPLLLHHSTNTSVSSPLSKNIFISVVGLLLLGLL